jgi:AraC family L-rhamnose operon regulatory protein RhaS
MFGDERHRSARRSLGPHYNPGIEICLCRAGVYRWDVEGRPVEIRHGELSVTRPWELHSGWNNLIGPGRLNWIILAAAGSGADGIDAPELEELLGSEAGSVLAAFERSRHSFVGSIPEAERLFDEIREELARPALGRLAAVRSAVARLIVLVAREIDGGPRSASEREPVPEGVLAVLNEVREDPARAWTTAEMAEAAGLGVTAFTEWCGRVTGRSPRWYLLQERLARAIKMLEAGEASITDAALATGFSSSQHFSTAFRKLYGESPSAYLTHRNQE